VRDRRLWWRSCHRRREIVKAKENSRFSRYCPYIVTRWPRRPWKRIAGETKIRSHFENMTYNVNTICPHLKIILCIQTKTTVRDKVAVPARSVRGPIVAQITRINYYNFPREPARPRLTSKSDQNGRPDHRHRRRRSVGQPVHIIIIMYNIYIYRGRRRPIHRDVFDGLKY
jgi:hypothetical protein